MGARPMSDTFFKHPILNSPYDYPSRHWELDDRGLPTQEAVESHRESNFISLIPKPRRTSGELDTLPLGEIQDLATDGQRYRLSEPINLVRREVDAWRRLHRLSPSQWRVAIDVAPAARARLRLRRQRRLQIFKTTLKAEIDPDVWATLNSGTYRPLPKPSTGRFAVKVINHFGNEVIKVFKV